MHRLYGIAGNEKKAAETRSIEFVTRYSTGDVRAVETHNSVDACAMPKLPQVRSLCFPHVDDPVHLYQLHQAFCQLHARGRQKTLRVTEEYRGDAVAYLRDVVLRETYQDQEETGYFRYNAAKDCWRLTIRGAYVMTWTQMWPFKQIIHASIRRKGIRLERDLTMNTV